MIKSINEKTTRIEIDLTGPDGNAFVLIGMAGKFAKQLCLDINITRTNTNMKNIMYSIFFFMYSRMREFANFILDSFFNLYLIYI